MFKHQYFQTNQLDEDQFLVNIGQNLQSTKFFKVIQITIIIFFLRKYFQSIQQIIFIKKILNQLNNNCLNFCKQETKSIQVDKQQQKPFLKVEWQKKEQIDILNKQKKKQKEQTKEIALFLQGENNKKSKKF
ncbi:unnamed protein product [Paramecium sonneborni]|uniref:Uncharacterized protein n=1 Tax=Paramecium sonneborni TaxID=65129 RepID=A0A8S1R6I4_9CILI|nr:unnamed protein product [Paramecium sonneborni]